MQLQILLFFKKLPQGNYENQEGERIIKGKKILLEDQSAAIYFVIRLHVHKIGSVCFLEPRKQIKKCTFLEYERLSQQLHY